MKSSLVLISATMAFSAPLAAADSPAAPQLPNAHEAQNARSPQAVARTDVAPARAEPIARPDRQPPEPDWRRINHKINKRAKNAVENGANPLRVRKKVQAYKRKLHRRWKASQ
ncbi:hypothetical protein [Parasphingorhabdus sp.]|uniref:hypothetical protein n=1 Tax=Parasphingorhabdus sp. TaxID=2709688 RepID=UPI003C70EAA1